jgi:RNA polymerase sigma factor (TIGR02999 family)
MSKVAEVQNLVNADHRLTPAELLPIVYSELRKLAAVRMAGEAGLQTLQPTALVHEAYLRLIGPKNEARWEHQGHFFAAAAEAMRRILVDAARRKAALRHGGDRTRDELHPDIAVQPELHENLVALDEALERLAAIDSVKAELVKLRYFAGLTLPEAAATLGISERTAGRHWAYARAWLRREVERSETQS